jgi:hypothetical protein
MRVSVLCLADRWDRLPVLVWSLLAQTHQDWELLVLNQSGADVMRGCHVGDTRVREFHVPRIGDWGQSAKEQAALAHATGDAFMFPNDDAYYVPIALQRMVEALERGADLALCGWLYDLPGYVPMPPCPAVGHVDVGGFMVRRQAFEAHGWPRKGQTGDGELVVSLAARPGTKVELCPQVLYCKN